MRCKQPWSASCQCVPTYCWWSVLLRGTPRSCCWSGASAWCTTYGRSTLTALRAASVQRCGGRGLPQDKGVVRGQGVSRDKGVVLGQEVSWDKGVVWGQEVSRDKGVGVYKLGLKPPTAGRPAQGGRVASGRHSLSGVLGLTHIGWPACCRPLLDNKPAKRLSVNSILTLVCKLSQDYRLLYTPKLLSLLACVLLLLSHGRVGEPLVTRRCLLAPPCSGGVQHCRGAAGLGWLLPRVPCRADPSPAPRQRHQRPYRSPRPPGARPPGHNALRKTARHGWATPWAPFLGCAISNGRAVISQWIRRPAHGGCCRGCLERQLRKRAPPRPWLCLWGSSWDGLCPWCKPWDGFWPWCNPRPWLSPWSNPWDGLRPWGRPWDGVDGTGSRRDARPGQHVPAHVLRRLPEARRSDGAAAGLPGQGDAEEGEAGGGVGGVCGLLHAPGVGAACG